MKQPRYVSVPVILASVAISLLCLPAMASAGGWDVDYATVFPVTFTATGGQVKFTRAGGTVTCEHETAHGEYITATTGVVEISFESCSGGLLGGPPTTPGQPSGKITTATLEFHNIMIDSTAQVSGGTAGILYTTNKGVFTSYECSLFEKVTVGGNGVIADLKQPKCGEASNEWTWVFESSKPGFQRWMQITTEGTQYDLTSSVNGGAAETTSLDSDTTVKFIEMARVTCP
jgi:hypothetical protein